MRRVVLALFAVTVLAGCTPGGSPTCAAWHCALPATDPDGAMTRPEGAARPGRLDISFRGDLCERHVGQSPFVLAGRFILVFGLVPALAFGYIAFRVLWIFDKHGPGLAWFGEKAGRRVLFGLPIAVIAGWLAFFLFRAW